MPFSEPMCSYQCPAGEFLPCFLRSCISSSWIVNDLANAGMPFLEPERSQSTNVLNLLPRWWVSSCFLGSLISSSGIANYLANTSMLFPIVCQFFSAGLAAPAVLVQCFFWSLSVLQNVWIPKNNPVGPMRSVFQCQSGCPNMLVVLLQCFLQCVVSSSENETTYKQPKWVPLNVWSVTSGMDKILCTQGCPKSPKSV